MYIDLQFVARSLTVFRAYEFLPAITKAPSWRGRRMERSKSNFVLHFFLGVPAEREK